jgi:hypothetical protein
LAPAHKTGPAPVATKTTTPAGKTATGKTAATKAASPINKAPVTATSNAKPATPASPAGKTPPATVAAATPEKKTPPRGGAFGRRDPFLSVIRAAETGGVPSTCSSGKRCLSIPELILQGTVRDISGKMLAIVVNNNRRTFTLRENDQLFNGSVEKITTDSIIFREFVKDALGRETAREVVKKMGPAS